jgi:hypothetical protein
MKHIPPIIAILLVVIGCSLTERFKKSGTANAPKGTTTVGGDPVEQPSPTAAQVAAIANGQTAKWDQQGITWTLPANWKKQSVATEIFNYGGDGAFLIVNISAMASSFPTDISLKAMHEGAKVNEKNGKNDELKWLELDGLRGVEFRESKPEMADDIRRLEWQAYRNYSGQTQLVTMILSSRGDNFTKHQDELYGILYSTKLVH